MVIVLFICFLQSYGGYDRLMWERAISEAVNDRDTYYRRVGVHDLNSLPALIHSSDYDKIKKNLFPQRDPASPWYHFLSGAAYLQATSKSVHADSCFSKAMVCAENRIGQMWVLFHEFRRIDQKYWIKKSLEKTEAFFLRSGAHTAPILTQQLFAIAQKEAKKKNYEDAEFYFNWSARFEQYPVWQTVGYGLNLLPQNPLLLLKSFGEFLRMLKLSWWLQVSLLFHIYTWVRNGVVVYIALIFLIAMIKAVPIVLHSVMDFFPRGTPVSLRFTLCTCMYISLVSFGMVPFLLLTAFLVHRHLPRRLRWFFICATVLLVAAPFDARIQEMFRKTLSDNEPLGIFKAVVTHAWYPELEQQVTVMLESNSVNPLTHLAAAILYQKKNDQYLSLKHLNSVEREYRNDPVFLLTAGRTAVFSGDTAQAAHYFTECVNRYPDNERAIYNLGQLNLLLMNTSEGSQQLTRAASLNPSLINSFIQKNAAYFLDHWPRLRQFAEADYTPDYFWKHIFPSQNGSWKSSQMIWGSAFFGVGPLVFLGVALVFFLTVFSIKSSNKAETIFFCKLCKNPMCRKCRVGSVCRDCTDALHNVKNKDLQEQIRIRIQKRKRFSNRSIQYLLTSIIPGGDFLYSNKPLTITGSILFCLSIGIYAFYMSLGTITSVYPSSGLDRIVALIFIPALLYNLFFVYRSIKGFVHDFKK